MTGKSKLQKALDELNGLAATGDFWVGTYYISKHTNWYGKKEFDVYKIVSVEGRAEYCEELNKVTVGGSKWTKVEANVRNEINKLNNLMEN